LREIRFVPDHANPGRPTPMVYWIAAPGAIT
jgi:hypothetical protein